MFETPGKVSHERTVAMVRTAGLDEMRTAKDLESPALKAEIKKNLDLGRALGLTGTPSYVVGNTILSGAVGYEKLKEAVAAARKAEVG
jgi:protein-disulfide isomerase